MKWKETWIYRVDMDLPPAVQSAKAADPACRGSAVKRMLHTDRQDGACKVKDILKQRGANSQENGVHLRLRQCTSQLHVCRPEPGFQRAPDSGAQQRKKANPIPSLHCAISLHNV